jgi:hypothetical protein
VILLIAIYWQTHQADGRFCEELTILSGDPGAVYHAVFLVLQNRIATKARKLPIY